MITGPKSFCLYGFEWWGLDFPREEVSLTGEMFQMPDNTEKMCVCVCDSDSFLRVTK